MHAISADDLIARLDDADAPFLLDVREPDEFVEWQIPGTVNIPLGSLARRVGDVPTDREVVTVCATGHRATTALDVLGAAGIDAELLEGGMGAWALAYDDAELRVADATVVQVRRRGKGCLSYLVGAAGAAVVIDPSVDLGQYLDRAAERGWAITHVVDTHLHADHLSGARALAAASGARLLLDPDDHFAFDHDPITDGMRLSLAHGVALTVSLLATPGHTMGSTALLLGEAAIFTGDTLFLESVGRPDLADRAEEFARVLYRSLHDKVLWLPDDALVLPAHFGAAVEVRGHEVVTARLGALRERLVHLDASEEAFVAWAAGAASERPPNYAAIVEANRAGASLDAEVRAGLEAGPNRCAVAN